MQTYDDGDENDDAILQKQSAGVFCQNGVLSNFTKFTGKHLSCSLFFNKVAVLRPATKKETPKQVFCCEFCQFFKNTFFIEHLRWFLILTDSDPVMVFSVRLGKLFFSCNYSTLTH